MKGLNADHAVQVLVPREDGRFKFGSGYGIGPHWVLTARHVLCGEGVASDRLIRLRCGERSEDLSRERIQWEDAGLDLALIRCDSLVAGAPDAHHVLATNRPSPGEEWSGYGWSGVLPGDEDGRRELPPFGRVGHYRSDRQRASFTSTTVTLKEDAYWAGFSGSPLFVDGRLSAVAIKVNGGESGAGLLGSFVSDALDTAGGKEGKRLAEWLEMDGFAARRETERRLESEIVDRLNRHDVLLKRLNEVYRQFIDPRWESANSLKLFEALRSATDDRVVACLNKIVKEFVDKADSSSVRMVDFLARSWLLFVSSARGPIRGLSGFQEDPSGKPLTVDVVAPEVVDLEALLAFVEGRKPLLEMRMGRLRAPLNYTLNHPVGLDEEGAQAWGDLRGLLELRAVPGSGAFVDAVMERFEFEMTQPEQGISKESWGRMDEAARYAHIRQHLLETQMEKEGSVYACVSDRDDPQLEKFRVHCPQLLLIEAKSDDDGRRGPVIRSLNKTLHVANLFLNGHEGASR